MILETKPILPIGKQLREDKEQEERKIVDSPSRRPILVDLFLLIF